MLNTPCLYTFRHHIAPDKPGTLLGFVAGTDPATRSAATCAVVADGDGNLHTLQLDRVRFVDDQAVEDRRQPRVEFSAADAAKAKALIALHAPRGAPAVVAEPPPPRADDPDWLYPTWHDYVRCTGNPAREKFRRGWWYARRNPVRTVWVGECADDPEFKAGWDASRLVKRVVTPPTAASDGQPDIYDDVERTLIGLLPPGTTVTRTGDGNSVGWDLSGPGVVLTQTRDYAGLVLMLVQLCRDIERDGDLADGEDLVLIRRPDRLDLAPAYMSALEVLGRDPTDYGAVVADYDPNARRTPTIPEILTRLCDVIDASDGLVSDDEMGHGRLVIAPEWHDMASVYLQACEALGRTPQWEEQPDGDGE
jgi:hypothetical protein